MKQFGQDTALVRCTLAPEREKIDLPIAVVALLRSVSAWRLIKLCLA